VNLISSALACIGEARQTAATSAPTIMRIGNLLFGLSFQRSIYVAAAFAASIFISAPVWVPGSPQ
ncbi:MAG: hypothetical protein P8Y36_12070, partial [Alphaproteobacteria bacterium]